MTLPEDTKIHSPNFVKHNDKEEKFKIDDIAFYNSSADDLKQLYDKGYEYCETYFDLMVYFYDNGILK